MKDSDLRGITTEGLIEELERRQVSFEKYKEMGSWIAREKELVHFREILQQIEDEGSGHGQALARIALKGAGDFDVKCRDAGGVTVGRYPAQSCVERSNVINIK